MKHDVGDCLLLYELGLAFQRSERCLAGLRKRYISYRGDAPGKSLFRATCQIIHPAIGDRNGFGQGQMHMRVNAWFSKMAAELLSFCHQIVTKPP